MQTKFDVLIHAFFSAPEERQSRALLILQGADIPLRIDEPHLLSMGNAAKFLGISRTSLWRLIKIGRLEKVELYPGSFRVRRADLLDLVGKKGSSNE